LPPGATALAIVHRTVDEIWYVLSGRAEIWRKRGEHEEVIEAGPGTSLTIPVGTSFQFRTVGDEPLRFVMFTMPPWPGDDEARRIPNHWPVDRSR
jgi:mannose-6-phosphate isomerase-like protein (cupin superfamily)